MLYLHLELFNLQLLHAHFLLCLTACDLLFLGHVFAPLMPLKYLNILLESVVLLRLLVDFLEERHIVLHEALVGILVFLLVFSHGVTIVVKLGFHVPALEGVRGVCFIVVIGAL